MNRLFSPLSLADTIPFWRAEAAPFGAFIAQRFSRKLRVASSPPRGPLGGFCTNQMPLFPRPNKVANRGPCCLVHPGLDGRGAEGGLAVLSALPL